MPRMERSVLSFFDAETFDRAVQTLSYTRYILDKDNNIFYRIQEIPLPHQRVAPLSIRRGLFFRVIYVLFSYSLFFYVLYLYNIFIFQKVNIIFCIH